MSVIKNNILYPKEDYVDERWQTDSGRVPTNKNLTEFLFEKANANIAISGDHEIFINAELGTYNSAKHTIS